MPARLVQRLTPDDVGKRVTVRWRDDDGRPTDVVGWLRAWEGGWLHVERRDGSLARVPDDRLLAGKVVPTPPPKR